MSLLCCVAQFDAEWMNVASHALIQGIERPVF